MPFTIKDPYQQKNNEYKGQLHSHSTDSDGADTPTALVTAYKNAGYDFICLSDHDDFTPDPEVGGILFIGGSEETTPSPSKHILSVSPNSQKTVTSIQDAIDQINADNGLAFVAHPTWATTLWSDDLFRATKRYAGLEIYNAVIFNEFPTQGNSEEKWDAILSAGHRKWGIAVDDCHDISDSEFNKAWVNVFADELTDEAIVESLRTGNFYASTGAEVEVSVEDDVITAETPASSTIEFIGFGGVVLQSDENVTTADYTVTGNELYVRVRVTRDSDDKMAWSNPLLVVQEDGWNTEIDEWVYNNATSFKVEGKDVRAKFPKGTRIEYRQYGDLCHGTVKSTQLSGSDTIVNLMPNADFSLVNAEITDNYYSYELCPPRYPFWFNHTPTHTGFSSAPTNVISKFCVVGAMIHWIHRENTEGTSNSSSFTISLPVQASNRGAPDDVWVAIPTHTNNAVNEYYAGVGVISQGGTVIALWRNGSATGWTSSGNKKVGGFEVFYEF